MSTKEPKEDNLITVLAFMLLEAIIDHWKKIVTIILVVLCMVMVAKCEVPTYTHKWKEGDIVCIKISNQRAQVIDANKRKSKLEIRFAVTNIINDDGATITTHSYDNLNVMDYEVMECEQ